MIAKKMFLLDKVKKTHGVSKMPQDIFSAQNLDVLTRGDYANVFELLHTGIAIMSPTGHFVYCNSAFLHMFNLPGNVKGKHVSDFFVSGEAGVMTTIRTKQPTFCTSLTTDNEQGISFRYPLIDANGDLHGVIIESISPSIGKEKIGKLLNTIKTLEEKSNYFEQKKLRKTGRLFTFDDILGKSESIKNLKQLGERFALSQEPILLTGESGSGKELVAQALHSASFRADKPLVVVNCAALPHDLMEAELFGYEAGAFTGALSGGSKGKFELADKGTIFLDEIGELPLGMQAKLLRVLESGEIQKLGHKGALHSDFRLIAATNRNLSKCTQEGTFREDLYHRLNILEIAIPPLRERLNDIPLLSRHFIEQHVGQQRAQEIQISQELYRILRSARWPGNIRELKNVLTYALFNLGDSKNILTVEHLPKRFLDDLKDKIPETPKKVVKSVTHPPRKHNTQSMDEARFDAESNALREALRKAKYNKSLAAQMLGISRNKLYRKLKQLGLSDEIRVDNN